METDLTETGDKLELSCIGKYNQADLLRLIDQISEARSRNPEVRKCLMDALSAEIQLGGIGEFFVGEYAAKRLGGMKIAVLALPGQISNLLENTAYNRGLKIRMSTTREDAEAWLAE
jgi:hypothetical protein